MMVAEMTPSAGRYVHRRGEAIFAIAIALLAAWQSAGAVRANVFHVRLLNAFQNDGVIADADRQRAVSTGDAIATWMAGRSVWRLSRNAGMALAIWKASPPPNADRLGILANQEWREGRERVALDDIRMALALQPENAMLPDTLGNWRVARKETEPLRDDMQSILARAPRNATALAHHGWTLYQTGNRAEARAELERAIAIDPDNRAALRKISRFLVETGGDDARAERLLLHGDRRWPDDDFFFYQLAQLYAAQKRYAAAEPYMRRLATSRRDDADAREVVGLYWAARGDYAAALDHFRAATRLRPDEPRFAADMADALAHTGRPGAQEPKQ